MASADNALTVGVDLGGTKVEVAWVDRDGRIIGATRRPTGRERGPEGILADLIACLTEDCFSSTDHPMAGVGVGVAGQVDPATGVVSHAPNLAWNDFPLRARLKDALRMPISVVNDVQAATYGEWKHGAGRDVENLVCLFVGTGIGGGVVSSGRLLQGCGGSAGELGHITIERHGPRCSCGNRGCLEAFAAGWAIARRAQEAVAADRRAGETLLRLAGGDSNRLTAGTVAKAVHQGDPLASQLLRETGEALGVGIASVANAFNPCLVILGGGVVEGLPELVDIAQQETRSRALDAALRSLRIVRPSLGRHAGTIGAAVWARHNLENTKGED